MQFDAQLQTITQDHIVPKVTDEVSQSNVLALIFLSNGRPWMGESMKFPVKLTSHTQGGSFDDYQGFSTQNENVRQLASFDIRAYYQSIVIGGIARSVNEGSKAAVLGLIKTEMESAHQDMVTNIGTILYADGTGNSSKNFLGLAAGIDDGGNVATYGGLSRSTYTSWASVEQTTVGAFDFTKQRTLHNSASVGNQKPSIDVCNETVFGYIESDYSASLDGNYNVMQSSRYRLTQNGMKPAMQDGLTGHAGYDALYFAGTPIVKDDKSTAGFEWAINTDYFRWYGAKAAECTPISITSQNHEGNDYDQAPKSTGFNWTGFVRPHDQFAWVGQIILLGQLINIAPRLSSSSAGITS